MVDAAEAMQAGGQGREYVAGIAFAALLDDLSANAQQAFSVGQVLVFLLELLQLVFAQAQAFQLFKLIAEQLMTCALFVAGVGETLQLLSRLRQRCAAR